MLVSTILGNAIKKKGFRFAVPVVWREQKVIQIIDIFVGLMLFGYHAKNEKVIVYPNPSY